MSRENTEQLRALATNEGLTLNTLLMSAWGLMLSRYSGEPDIVFGATKTTRRGTIADADSIAGVFLATIPVRLTVNAELSVLNWLHSVRDKWVSLRGFEHLPLVEIRQVSDVPTPRLFDTLFVFENYRFGTRLNEQGGPWSSRHFHILEQTGFPLTLSAYGDRELALKIQYDATRFAPATIDYMMGHLTTLLEGWAPGPQGPVWATNMLTAAERHTMLHDWNETGSEYPRDALIHELFSEQSARRPDAIAIECDGTSPTYGALEARTNAFAATLLREGVTAGDRVGLFAERSIAHVVATIAILKAGAVFLWLEPGYPSDRLLYMIGDANTSVVLAPPHLLQQLTELIAQASSPVRALEITSAAESSAASQVSPQETRESASSAGMCAAYVMYTSGSSGRPKGVSVSHRGVVRLVRNTSYMQFSANDVMLGLATTMFDASTWETWTRC